MDKSPPYSSDGILYDFVTTYNHITGEKEISRPYYVPRKKKKKKKKPGVGAFKEEDVTLEKPDEIKKPCSEKVYCESSNCYHAKKGKSQHIKTKKHQANINFISE